MFLTAVQIARLIKESIATLYGLETFRMMLTQQKK